MICDCCGKPVHRLGGMGLVCVGRVLVPFEICRACHRELDRASPERREELFQLIELRVLPTKGAA